MSIKAVREGLGVCSLAVLAAVIALSVAGYFVLGGGAESPGPTPLGPLEERHPVIGQLAPDFRLVDARDPTKNVRLSDFRGKSVVVNWYATWCGPCRAEIPAFQSTYEALHGEVVFLGVNLRESRSDAIGLMDDLRARYPTVLDTDGAVARAYRITGMPSTFFIDKDGIVRNFGSGGIDAEFLQQQLNAMGYAY